MSDVGTLVKRASMLALALSVCWLAACTGGPRDAQYFGLKPGTTIHYKVMTRTSIFNQTDFEGVTKVGPAKFIDGRNYVPVEFRPSGGSSSGVQVTYYRVSNQGLYERSGTQSPEYLRFPFPLPNESGSGAYESPDEKVRFVAANKGKPCHAGELQFSDCVQFNIRGQHRSLGALDGTLVYANGVGLVYMNVNYLFGPRIVMQIAPPPK